MEWMDGAASARAPRPSVVAEVPRPSAVLGCRSWVPHPSAAPGCRARVQVELREAKGEARELKGKVGELEAEASALRGQARRRRWSLFGTRRRCQLMDRLMAFAADGPPDVIRRGYTADGMR